MPNIYHENRDMRCASDVSRMAALGRFDTEFLVYGCAYQHQNKIYYQISDNQKAQQDFFQQSVRQNCYPTPVVRYIHRSAVPAGMEEQIMQETKLQLAQQFKQQYPRQLFVQLSQFANQPNVDYAAPLFNQWFHNIRYQFESEQLQLFAQTLLLAYQAKKLTAASFSALEQQLQNILRQFDDDPVCQERFNRTFYGFRYQTMDGKIAQTIDAQYTTVFDQYMQSLQNNSCTAPIFSKQYTFSDFSYLATARKDFTEQLHAYQNSSYFSLLNQLQTLSAAISQNQFLQVLEEQPNQACKDVFTYYGRRWQLL